MDKETRKSVPILPISTVMQLTNLTLKKEVNKRTFRGMDLDELDFRSIVQEEMQHL